MMTEPQLNLRYSIRHESTRTSGKETLDLMLITTLYQLQLLFSLDWLEITIIHGKGRGGSGYSLFPCSTPVWNGWKKYKKNSGYMLPWLSLLPENFRMQVGCFSAELSLCSLPDQYAFFSLWRMNYWTWKKGTKKVLPLRNIKLAERRIALPL
jgi:hypothetical protein